MVASEGKPTRTRSKTVVPQSVFKRMDDMERKVEGVLRNQDLGQLTLQRVESKMDAVLLLVGTEEEDGEGGFKGVGLLGRMRRVEESQSTLMSKYKTWIAWGGGFISAMGAGVAVIWWLIADKLEIALKGAGH